MPVPNEPLYLKSGVLTQKLFSYLPLILCGCFIASCFFILKEKNNNELICTILVSIWIILQPMWFFYEHFYHFPKNGNPAAGWDRLKEAQAVTSKVWIAFAVILSALLSGKFNFSP